MPEPGIVTHKGKPVSVIIPIKDYEELLERVEDAEDIAALRARAESRFTTARLRTAPPRANGSEPVSHPPRTCRREGSLAALIRGSRAGHRGDSGTRDKPATSICAENIKG